MLERWRSVFPDQAVFVGFLEDMTSDPVSFSAALADHLGIASEPLAESLQSSKTYNSTSSLRSNVPEEWERRLAEMFLDTIDAIAQEFGAAAADWRRRATSAVSGS
jgi:hypothetical protein